MDDPGHTAIAIPTVSVIIPAYNCGSYIDEALESLERQTWPPTEVMVVDDGSSDDTARRVTRFAAHSQLDVTLVSQTNQGIAAARNEAAHHCTSKFIALLDGDDAFYPRFLERSVTALLRHPELVLCFSDRDVVDGGKRFLRKDLDHPRFRAMAATPLGNGVYRLADNPFMTLLAGNVIPIGNLVLPRATFEASGGFDPDLRAVEDKSFLLKLTTYGTFGFVDESLGIWRRHDSNTSGRDGAYRMSWYRNLGMQKLAKEAAGTNFTAAQRAAIAQMQTRFAQRLLYTAADTGQNSFPRLAYAAFRQRPERLLLVLRYAIRFAFRRLQGG